MSITGLFRVIVGGREEVRSIKGVFFVGRFFLGEAVRVLFLYFGLIFR